MPKNVAITTIIPISKPMKKAAAQLIFLVKNNQNVKKSLGHHKYANRQHRKYL